MSIATSILASGSAFEAAPFICIGIIGIIVYWYMFWEAKSKEGPSPVRPQLDLLIVRTFIPGQVAFAENLENVHPLRRFFRVGLAFAAFGLFFLISDDIQFLGWLIVIIGVGSAIWMYFNSEPPDALSPSHANFQLDHLVVTRVGDLRDVFVLSGGVAFFIEVRRVPFGLLEKESQVKHGYSLTVSEGGRSVVLPLEFPGSGEFLALWRKDGAAVTFAEDVPSWFIGEMRQLPSWRRGYFDKPPELPKQTNTLLCADCGSVDQYDNSRNMPCCHFCGSSDLRAPLN
jgi:hypothetical protein